MSKVVINNWRWAGVPFYIRTGKKLSTRASEIIITFKNLQTCAWFSYIKYFNLIKK